ncbi:TlpA disulfide reductase family protein [Atopobacter sp. AH10]|uniref:TlpA family protein disulfide reductase n=1 Tax=Atopobacter sp. AH10 TaxID=2315861 RepID=UPI001313F436|nr:TlpA disulfide reductase family protein [Atopobacter sp. AH10]
MKKRFVFLVSLMVIIMTACFYYFKPTSNHTADTDKRRKTEQVAQQTENHIVTKEAAQKAKEREKKAVDTPSAGALVTKSDDQEEKDPIATLSVPQDRFLIHTNEKDKTELNFAVPERRVILFWSSWADVCEEQMKFANKLYQEYKGKVHFYAINGTDGEKETFASAKKFLDKNHITLPVYYDSDFQLHRAFKLSYYPTIIVQNNEGKTVFQFQGRVEEQKIQDAIKQIL